MNSKRILPLMKLSCPHNTQSTYVLLLKEKDDSLYCPGCGEEVKLAPPLQQQQNILQNKFHILQLAKTGKGIEDPQPSLFRCSIQTAEGLSFSGTPTTASTGGFSFGDAASANSGLTFGAPVATTTVSNFRFVTTTASSGCFGGTPTAFGFVAPTVLASCGNTGLTFPSSTPAFSSFTFGPPKATATTADFSIGAPSAVNPPPPYNVGITTTQVTAIGLSFSGTPTTASTGGFSFGDAASANSGLTFGAPVATTTVSNFRFVTTTASSGCFGGTPTAFGFVAPTVLASCGNTGLTFPSSTPAFSSFTFGPPKATATTADFSIGAPSAVNPPPPYNVGITTTQVTAIETLERPIIATNDREEQSLIPGEIRQVNVEAAMEQHPEIFEQVTMLYVKCRVNGHPVRAFIDSGAKSTEMSQACAERCGIMRLVDHRWAGIAKGVGTQNVIGRIHLGQIQIEEVFLTSSFSILEDQPMDMLLGLDMLKRHQCCIDLKRNIFIIGTTGTETFIHEGEFPLDGKLHSTKHSIRDGTEHSIRDFPMPCEDDEKEKAVKLSDLSDVDVNVSNAGISLPALNRTNSVHELRPVVEARTRQQQQSVQKTELHQTVIYLMKEIKAEEREVEMALQIADCLVIHPVLIAKVKNVKVIATSVCYLACKLVGTVRTYKNISSVYSLPWPKVVKATDEIVKSLAIDVKLPTAKEYMMNWFSDARFSKSFIKRAHEIADKILKLNISLRHTALSCAAFCLYFASISENILRLHDISQITGVSSTTINKIHTEYLKHAEQGDKN